MTIRGTGNRQRRIQIVVETIVTAALLLSTLFTLFVEPGIPAARPWILPLGLVAMASGLAGVVARRGGYDRLAGAFYIVAALAPNGLYPINVLVFSMGAASLAGLKLDTESAKKASLSKQA